ncbi:MAG: phosphoglucosamine mutase [Eggerthellaceae bacterium]|nr:phosphoglucosamine mutase [Eggerthellaceae bacterium]
MGKYFGTDGFRGEANVDLTSWHAYQIGRYLGAQAAKAADGNRAQIVIGKDTRQSGDMFEHALAAGIVASGADAYLLDVVTTPGVAYLTRTGDFAFGVMVSASHNPFQDNGIKVLNSAGEKLDEETIEGIEAYIDGEIGELAYAQGDAIGRVIDHSAAVDRYAEFLISKAPASLAGYRIGLDCANGSASAVAPHVFAALGADVKVINNTPDGRNINVACGSTHIEGLCAFVKDAGLDVGFAYDGDADRCLAVDGDGNVIDGDQIMYVCGVHMKQAGRLTSNTVVTTIMSNFGLYKAFDEAGIAYEKTAVGDKYVYENMATYDHLLGGEQSGHIIFREFATTGDGVLTSLMVMEALIAAGKTIAELAESLTILPQVLKNVRVADKAASLADEAVQAAIATADDELGDDGRILVRQSGTEPVIRVMAEAPTLELCEEKVDAIIAIMRAQGHVIG